MQPSQIKNIHQLATKSVAIFLLSLTFISSTYLLFTIPKTYAATNQSIKELEKKKLAEQERAKRAKELKDQKERQSIEAKKEAEFLQSQVEEIQKQESQTENSIQTTQREIDLLSQDISTAEQKAAEEKRRTLEAAKTYFKQRRKMSIDADFGQLDILVGADLSESSRNEAKFEAIASLLRQRMTDYLKDKYILNDKKDVAEDHYQKLADLKSQQTNLRRSKQSTQVKYDRLASFSEQEAEKYGQEMQEALQNAAYWESKILQELTRLINARKSGNIPRTGASVGQKVNKGAVIGHQGNTGYSFGAHVHLEVRKDNVAVNPRNYLGGVLAWPLADFRITQEFGSTPYSARLYSSGLHSGLDLTQFDGANIFASCSGEIILDSVYGGYGRAFAQTCDGTDIVVLYGHMQSE